MRYPIPSNLTRTAKGRRNAARAGFLNIEHLRELALICGGIVVVLALPLVLRDVEQFQATSLTSAFQAGTTGEARPEHPVYSLCVLADEQSAWLRQSHSSLVHVSLADGNLLDRIPAISDRVLESAHSLDGRVHAYASLPGGSLVVIRDGEQCVEELLDIPGSDSRGLAVTADGSRVAAACGERILLWDLTISPPSRIEISANSISQKMMWCPGGDRLLVACDYGVVKMLSVDGKILWEQSHIVKRIESVAWGPWGALVAVGFSDGGDLAVLDAADGDLRWREKLDSISVNAVSFSPDGKRLATAGSDRIVSIISVENGQRLAAMSGHYDTVTALQFLSDGDRIVSASLDGTLRIWSAGARRELQKL